MWKRLQVRPPWRPAAVAMAAWAALVAPRPASPAPLGPGLPVRGWMILSDREPDALATIAAARAYDVNHLQLSHLLVHDLREIKDDARCARVNRLVDAAHAAGVTEVVLWDHALYKLDYYPAQFRTGPGDTLDLDNPAFWEWLKADYRAMLDRVPRADGIVLTFIETGARAERQHSQKLKTNQQKLAAVVDAVADVVVGERKLNLYARTFSYTHEEYGNVIGAVELFTRPQVRLMMKETPHDFFLTHPNDRYAGTIARPTLMEFDAAGEFHGQNVVAVTWPEYLLRRWRDFARRPHVVGYVARTDRYGDTRLVGTPGEINLLALKRGAADPEVTAEQVYDEFITARYGKGALDAVKAAFRNAFDIATSVFYTLGTNVANHSQLNYEPSTSSYVLHVSGKWLDPPIARVGHGVERELHYWRDVVDHIAPPFVKVPENRQWNEVRWVWDRGLIHPGEAMDEDHLRAILAEKAHGVLLAEAAAGHVERARRDLDPARYEPLRHHFQHTLLTARLHRATAAAYFGFRVWCRGAGHQSAFVGDTVQKGLAEIERLAPIIRGYPVKPPTGQWDWTKDADQAEGYFNLIVREGWPEKTRGVPNPNARMKFPYRAAPSADVTALFPSLAAQDTPRARLERLLSAKAHALLSARRATLTSVTTREALADRRRRVRETLRRLVGDLPTARTPLRARVTGFRQKPGFTVENVVFESQPGFPVTANLYKPIAGSGRWPALLASAGHGEMGKAAERLGPDLARKGFIVLAYDPLGQGERLQHYDPVLRASRAGGSTDEHGQLAARAELIGQSVAREFIWDAMRGVDYLVGRLDVDPERIGAVGCSGGGTVTTYLAALDERIKAAAVACYLTSWDALADGPGPQEAEQSVAGFLAEGLDMGDYVALIAPRPLLIVSTTDDFFPLEGARAVYEEGRRFYALAGAAEQIAWSVSPGGHGISREGREAIAEFFQRRLGVEGQSRDEGDARLAPEDLAVTDTGQVSTALRAKTVADLIAARAPRPALRHLTAADSRARRERTRANVARIAGFDPGARGSPPALTVHRSVIVSGGRLDVVSFAAADGLTLWGLLAVPQAGRRPAVLLADPRLRTTTTDGRGTDLLQLVGAGSVVLAVELRGTPTPAEVPARPNLLGPLVAMHRRAAIVGTSLAAMRTGDVLTAMDVLASQPDVDATSIHAVGRGGFAIPLLHAAVLDPRITRLALQETPVSYRAFLEHPLHRDLPEVLIPGVLRQYDVGDLLQAVAPRRVTLINPTDAMGQPMRRVEVERYLESLGEGGRGATRVLYRGREAPLLWE